MYCRRACGVRIRPIPSRLIPRASIFPPDNRFGGKIGDEAEEHYGHDGYVESVFRREMDRRHLAMMQSLGEQKNREQAEQRQREQGRRPWWKNLFA